MYNVIDYLENSTLKNKTKIAFICEDESITYEKLTYYSKCGGSYFIDKNVFNKLVFVYMDKSINTLISFFSLIYAGCSYSVINTGFPKERVSEIVKSAKCEYVITDEEHLEIAKEYFEGMNIININELKDYKINTNGIEIVKQKHIDIDPLYVNFTSGTTGTPKGVIISHRSVIDFIDKFTTLFNFKENDIIANQAPFDFDVSVKDIYSSIKMGATMLLIPKAYFSNPTKLLDYLCENNITTMTWAVSALCLITTFHGLDYKVPDKVNKIIFSGEVMPIKHLNKWMKHLPNTTFINVYGPTEITCNCTYYIIDKNKEYDKLPIGKPFPNERVILLDNDKEINTINTPGEICVIGTCLSLGYFNNEEGTNKAFKLNTNQRNYNEIVYHTGDIGYYNEDYDIVFNGRKDFQIKYLGHRIELEEIDKAFMKVDGVIRSCTIFDEEKSKLYGFYIGNIEKAELRSKLNDLIPSHMIPTSITKLEEFPLNKNGKIDRKKLMEMK